MSFNAIMKFGNKEGNDVLKCFYKLHRDVDAKGRPSSGVYGGTINLTIESTDDTSIVESMVNQYKPVDGVITFKKSDEDAKMKELEFTKAYVIDFEEVIDVAGSKPMEMVFTISAETLKIGNAEHKNEWPA